MISTFYRINGYLRMSERVLSDYKEIPKGDRSMMLCACKANVRNQGHQNSNGRDSEYEI